MNSFLTHLVRGDHSLHLAAHLAAGILCLLLLSGAAQPSKPAAPAPAQTVAGQVAANSPLVVASVSR